MDSTTELTLDPEDWERIRAAAHQAVDQAIHNLRNIRQGPVWQPVPETVREALTSMDLPVEGAGFDTAWRELCESIWQHPTGNTHPRFWGWVHGSGNAGAIVAAIVEAAMNSNCGGRDHGAVYVERCVLDWAKRMIGFPREASGLLVSGTSMATLIALTVARNAALPGVRQSGLTAETPRLTTYVSSEAHECVNKALEVLGLGAQSVRSIGVDRDFRIDQAELEKVIERDRAEGFRPFCVVGSAGTVNTGAIDDLGALARIAGRESMWFHVDGAFGALAMLDERLRPRLAGIERADSIAFDFHKWMHVPYDAGCVLVRSETAHREAFSMRPAYLQGAVRGLAGGQPWFNEYGIELSRGFRALKVWMTLREHGTRKLGALVHQNCEQAAYLCHLVELQPELQLLAKATLNIVCFRYLGGLAEPAAIDRLNRLLIEDLHESGVAVPSSTLIDGRVAIRVCITNHRTRREDLDLFVAEVLRIGRWRAAAEEGLA